MDILAVIGVLAAIIGIPAAIVQVMDYLQKRREKRAELGGQGQPSSLPTVSQIPHNLPPRREFIGRETEKARVHEALRSRSYLVSVDGIGGIGKTVLALEVAHECLRASKGDAPTDGMATFDGFIWTTAKDRDLTLNALLDAIALTLEYPGIAQHPMEQKQIAVCKLLQEKPYLVIVDNFETITDEGVRGFLLNLPEPSKALITTREQRLRQVWSISLRSLAEPEALALIRSQGRRLGLASLERAEGRVLLRLYQATGGVPLAIKWAVGQIKQRGQSLDTVLAALHEARGDIFDNVFTRSWSLLSTTTRQVLTVMPIFATSASRAGIETASDVHHFVLDEALGQLVEMSLVDATDELDLAERRYSIHPLTRAFAAAKLQQEPEIQKEAQEHLAEFFEVFTKKHGGTWYQEGFSRLEPELPNILAVIQWCLEQQLVNVAMNLYYRGISTFMVFRGYWNDALALSQRVAEVAAEMEDELNAARCRVWPINRILRYRGDLDEAEQHMTQALAVFERLSAEKDIAYAKGSLGRTVQTRGEFERAGRLFGEALAFYRSTGRERPALLMTAYLAEVALDQDDLDTAWMVLSNSVSEPARQRTGEAGDLDFAWAMLGDSVLEAAHRVDDPEITAYLLNILGRVERRRGRLEQAKGFWMKSLIHMERANRLDGIANALADLARLELEMGQIQTAVERLSAALETYRRLDMQAKVKEVEALLIELKEEQADDE